MNKPLFQNKDGNKAERFGVSVCYLYVYGNLLAYKDMLENTMYFIN